MRVTVASIPLNAQDESCVVSTSFTRKSSLISCMTVIKRFAINNILRTGANCRKIFLPGVHRDTFGTAFDVFFGGRRQFVQDECQYDKKHTSDGPDGCGHPETVYAHIFNEEKTYRLGQPRTESNTQSHDACQDTAQFAAFEKTEKSRPTYTPATAR